MTGAELKQARLTLGWTQARLAEALHVSPNTIARYEMPSNTGKFPIPHWVAFSMNIYLSQPPR